MECYKQQLISLLSIVQFTTTYNIERWPKDRSGWLKSTKIAMLSGNHAQMANWSLKVCPQIMQAPLKYPVSLRGGWTLQFHSGHYYYRVCAYACLSIWCLWPHRAWNAKKGYRAESKSKRTRRRKWKNRKYIEAAFEVCHLF